jgi:hypothetical protein
MQNNDPTFEQLKVLFDAVMPHLHATMQARDDLQDAFNGMRVVLQQFVVSQACRQAGEQTVEQAGRQAVLSNAATTLLRMTNKLLDEMGWSLAEYDDAFAEQLDKWHRSVKLSGLEHTGLEGDGEE